MDVNAKTIACPHCDLLLQTNDLKTGEYARCSRCKQIIALDDRPFDVSLALLFTALIVYFPAIFLPFLGIETAGQTNEISLVGSITSILSDNMAALAIGVGLLIIAFPLLKIIGLISIILPISRQHDPFFGTVVTRFILDLAPWAMIEVFLIGVLVSIVKLQSYATIHVLPGLYAFVALIIINAIINMRLPRARIWQSIRQLNL